MEENESLESQSCGSTAASAGLLVNLETSVPDGYQDPPAPLPFNVLLSFPQAESESLRDILNGSSFRTLLTCDDFEGPNCKAQANSLPSQAKFETLKSNEQVIAATEDEDVCPICLEGKISPIVYVLCIFSIFLLLDL